MNGLSFQTKTYLSIIFSFVILIVLYTLSNNIAPIPSIIEKENIFDISYSSIPTSRNICTTDTYNQGKWIKQSIGLTSNTIQGIDQQVGYYCNWDFAHKCYRRQDGREFERSKKILDYSWQPDSCMTYPFRAREFSKHLSENQLLLVGDSITQLMFESMYCLLGQDMVSQNKNLNLSGGDTKMWAAQLVHRDRVEEDSISLAYIRSDYLVKLDDFSFVKPNEGEGYQIGVGSNFPWIQAIPRFKYIMINTAAHWHPDLKWGPNMDRNELLAAYKKAMKKVFDYLKKNLREDQVLWVRSTPYGHLKCSQYTAPSDNIILPTGQKGEYEWDMFEKLDYAWKDMIEKEKDNRFQFFNVSMANYRGDVHSFPDGDCLHTCLPGPVDDWGKLLYHNIKKMVIDKMNKKK